MTNQDRPLFMQDVVRFSTHARSRRLKSCSSLKFVSFFTRLEVLFLTRTPNMASLARSTGALALHGEPRIHLPPKFGELLSLHKAVYNSEAEYDLHPRHSWQSSSQKSLSTRRINILVLQKPCDRKHYFKAWRCLDRPAAPPPYERNRQREERSTVTKPRREAGGHAICAVRALILSAP